MIPEVWKPFFDGISSQLNVGSIALELAGIDEISSVYVDPSMPIFDAVELLIDKEALKTSEGRAVTKRMMLKKPLRIIFFILITELEGRLYRVQEWSNRPVSELNEKNLNHLIVDLVDDPTLFSYQDFYKTRADFKEDLKAVSSIRNSIVHVNKKLELDIDIETVIKRKKQMITLLDALQQILDAQKRRRNHGGDPK